jgi:hypothetical protein
LLEANKGYGLETYMYIEKVETHLELRLSDLLISKLATSLNQLTLQILGLNARNSNVGPRTASSESLSPHRQLLRRRDPPKFFRIITSSALSEFQEELETSEFPKMLIYFVNGPVPSILSLNDPICRSRWPRGLRHELPSPARSNAGIVVSNPTQGMDVCVCCPVCRWRPCDGLIPVQGVLLTV